MAAAANLLQNFYAESGNRRFDRLCMFEVVTIASQCESSLTGSRGAADPRATAPPWLAPAIHALHTALPAAMGARAVDTVDPMLPADAQDRQRALVDLALRIIASDAPPPRVRLAAAMWYGTGGVFALAAPAALRAVCDQGPSGSGMGRAAAFCVGCSARDELRALWSACLQRETHGDASVLLATLRSMSQSPVGTLADVHAAWPDCRAAALRMAPLLEDGPMDGGGAKRGGARCGSGGRRRGGGMQGRK